jgi:hypothetical protein
VSPTWISTIKVAHVPEETGGLWVSHGGESICLYLDNGKVRDAGPVLGE